VFNFFRQEIGMTFAFYVILLAGKIGYQWTFFFFAIMGSVLGVSVWSSWTSCVHSYVDPLTLWQFIPIIVLMWRGKEIREKLGKPRNVNQFDTDGEGPGTAQE